MSVKLNTLGAGKITLPTFNFQSGGSNTANGIFGGAFIRVPSSFPNRASGGSYLWGYDPDNDGTYNSNGTDNGSYFWGPSVGGAASCLTAYGQYLGVDINDFTNDRNWTAAAPVSAGDYLFIWGVVNVGAGVLHHFKALCPVNGNAASAKTFVAASSPPAAWKTAAVQFLDRIFSTVGNQTEVGFGVEHFAIIEGQFPLSGGAPDTTWLSNLASGAKNWRDVATAISGDLRCWYYLSSKTDLTDKSGTGGTAQRSALTLTDAGGTGLATDAAIAPSAFTPSTTSTVRQSGGLRLGLGLGLTGPFVSGGGISTQTSLQVAVANMPTAHRTIYDAGETIRSTNEWDAGTPTNTVSSTWAGIATTINGLAANTHHLINISTTGTTATAVTIPAKDMGTGSITINGAGLQVDATVTVAPGARKFKWTNFDFVANGTAFDLTTPLGSGSSTPGTIMRWDSTCRFGRLWVSGKTESNWQEYTLGISCFHAEQIILDQVQFYGMSYCAGFHAVDLLVIRNCDVRQLINTAFTLSSEYMLARTKAPVIGSSKRYAFFITNTVRAQFDNMALYDAVNGNTAFMHTDLLQINPPDTLRTTVGSPCTPGQYYGTTGGKIYLCNSGSGNLSAEPTFTSGTVSAGGYSWTYIGTNAVPAHDIICVDNILCERGLTYTTGNGAHTQLQIYRDSHRNSGYAHAAFDSTVNTTLFAGNGIAASTGGYEMVGPSSVKASYNSYAGPVTPSLTVAAGNIVPASFDLTQRTTGTCDSAGEIITSATATGLTVTGSATCDARSGASAGTRPGDLFQGTFTTDANGNYKLNDTDAAILLSEATSRATFIAKFKQVFKPLGTVSAGVRGY